MVKGKRVNKRFHSSEEGSTSRDSHEQDSAGDISDGDDRDSESTMDAPPSLMCRPLCFSVRRSQLTPEVHVRRDHHD